MLFFPNTFNHIWYVGGMCLIHLYVMPLTVAATDSWYLLADPSGPAGINQSDATLDKIWSNI